VKRLPAIAGAKAEPKAPLDQFGTFEVFVQPKEGKPFQHEGIVHAPNLEMAYVLAKETFTRRFTCFSLCVAETRNVFVSPVSEGQVSAYDLLTTVQATGKPLTSFEIFHLPKRGKQHVHAGTVQAEDAQHAMCVAKQTVGAGKMTYNVWAIATTAIRFTRPEDGDFWSTLPEKKFRDAADYKGGDKLKKFLEKNTVTS